MANHFSAIKRMRQEQRRTLINRARKSRFRHQVKALRKLIDQKDGAAASAMLPQAFSMIDRAAKWGIIKKNTAARYKSRLHARVKTMAAAPAA